MVDHLYTWACLGRLLEPMPLQNLHKVTVRRNFLKNFWWKVLARYIEHKMYCVLAGFLIFQSSLIEKMDLLLHPKTDHSGNKNNDFLKRIATGQGQFSPNPLELNLNHLGYFKSQLYPKLYQFGKHWGSPKAPEMTNKADRHKSHAPS